MDKLGDIELFVTVVRLKGLAVAGRKLGLSPASVTAKLNRLESLYGVRLLTRTTRQISLTEEGTIFYKHCLRILDEMSFVEESLNNINGELKGPLRITSTVDLGKLYIYDLITEFIDMHPNVYAHLELRDDVVNLIEEDFDLAFRFGGLIDSTMVARKIASNKMVMFASPDYLSRHGTPKCPSDLKDHKFICLSRRDRSLTTYYFNNNGQKSSLNVNPIISSNSGAMIHQMALDGVGIVLKSLIDVKDDLKDGRLISILEDFNPDYHAERDFNGADLFAVYPSKDFLPERVRKFIELVHKRFQEDE